MWAYDVDYEGPDVKQCGCRKCLKADYEEQLKTATWVGLAMHPYRLFITCRKCGNKRCPHAKDHNNACTNSNEPNQEGGG